MSLPGSSSHPAESADKKEDIEAAGRAVVKMLELGQMCIRDSNYGGGIIGIHESKKKFGEVKATQIHVAFRTRDISELTRLGENFLNIRKYGIERDIIKVLKMLEKQKNLLLFFPYSFELIDILETDNSDDIIVSALNYDFHSLFEYRSLKAKEFETYFVTIFQDRFYIFSILDDTLCLIEKLDCMSLPTFIKLKNYHL